MSTIPEEVPFNFDLQQMKQVVESPIVTSPKGLSTDDRMDWLMNKSKEYNKEIQ